MPRTRPSLTHTTSLARPRQNVSDQIVLGVVTGGLLGPGFVIERRDAERLRFARVGGLLSTLPDVGEVELHESDTSGQTEVTFRLWCRGQSLRRLLLALLLGAVIASAAALILGWLIHWSIPTGVAVAIAHDLQGRFRERSVLRRQLDSYLRNITYLKAM